MKSNRIAYICMFFSSIVFIYFYGGKVPYTLFHVLLVLPFASLAYTLVLFFCFKFEQDLDNNFVIKGDKVKLTIRLENRSPLFYPRIKMTFCSDMPSDTQPRTESFPLVPFVKKDMRFELECRYRGKYRVGIGTVEFEDFLGIFKLVRRRNEKVTITVHPRVVFLDRLCINDVSYPEYASVLNKHAEDMVAVSDVRKYTYGDPPKRIHWKLTAKTNGLMVKNYQRTERTSTVLILDLKKNTYANENNLTIEDKVIESACAVAYYLLSRNFPINFVYCEGEVTSIHADDISGFDQIYNALSEVNFTGKAGVEDLLKNRFKNHSDRANIIIFTSNMTQSLQDQVSKMNFPENGISLVYISSEGVAAGNGMNADNILSGLYGTGINICVIKPGDEIKTILECQGLKDEDVSDRPVKG